MRYRHRLAALVASVALLSATTPARAGDYGAVANGNWTAAGTWSGGVVPGAADNAFVGSTTPAGALTTATVTVDRDTTAGNVYLGHDSGTSGTLALGDSTFTAASLYYGFVGAGAVTRGAGHLDVGAFDIRHGSFTPAPSDVIRNTVSVANGSSLSLSANLTLSDYLNIQDAGTTFDAGGKNITAANQVLLGWNGNGNPALVNRGAIATANLNVRNQNFQLTPSDSVGTFTLSNGSTSLSGGAAVNGLFLQSGATAAVAGTSNVVQRVGVQSGSSLTASAGLNLTDYLDVRDAGTVVDAQGGDLTAANQILYGWNGSGAPVLRNYGRVTTGHWLEANGVRAAVGSGADVIGQVSLHGNSRLTVAPAAGVGTGLTVTGTGASALDITAGSDLRLGDAGSAGGWVLRWKNPAGGDHVADLEALIGSGLVDFTNGGSYTISSQPDGYTYVLTPVPEPSGLLALLAGPAAYAVARRWRLRGTRP